MKQISETIDGSIKDIIQLKTLDNSLEYSQMFDALEDTPRDFQLKLVDALNSLGETMQVPPTEVFNKVLCKSDDNNEDVTKKLYNWWRAFFEVLGNCEKIPKERVPEFDQKIDDLMAEIMRAGDAEATDEEEPVMEESDDEDLGYQQATKDDEDKMLADMEFAIQHIGEVANKVKAVVNFINPYCETTFNEENNTMKFKKIDERIGGDSDEWVSIDDYVGEEFGESDNGEEFWKAMDDVDDLEKKGYWSGKFKVGDKVNWIEPDKGYPSDGWTIEDVTPGKHPSGDDLYIISRGKSSVMNIRGSELRPEKLMNEAKIMVDAHDVWTVLDLLSDEKANKNLTDLINSHVRTEAEIMDAIDSCYPDGIGKGELNAYMNDSFDEIVSELGLDVEKFKETGEFVDSDKPTSVELESDQKFNVGDEITWRHHNGSLSNEVVRELTDGGYIVDDGFAGENECYPGHAPEELLGKPNMEWDGKEWKQGIGMAEGTEEQKPDEVKSKDKTFNQDGENKTLVTGEENKKPVCEMTIEQEVDDPWKLSEMLWGQGKENLEELLRSGVVSEDYVMQMLEEMELRNLTNINDAFAYDFESMLDTFGCDPEAWSQNLEIKRKEDNY